MLEDMVEYGAIVEEKRASLEAALDELEFNAREYMTGLMQDSPWDLYPRDWLPGFDSLASSDRRWLHLSAHSVAMTNDVMKEVRMIIDSDFGLRREMWIVNYKIDTEYRNEHFDCQKKMEEEM